MQILDGRKVADDLLDKLALRLEVLNRGGIEPKLVIILVGSDPASVSYIRQKTKACERLKIKHEQINLQESITTEELILIIETLNADSEVHGILVQLPLPKHIEAPKVFKAIDPRKDVDGFTAYNLGKCLLSREFEDLAPCTPKGIIRLLEYYKIDVSGKDIVVVGASNIVGKPMSVMLLNRGATVTTCHILTKDLAANTRRADVLIVAVGKRNLITADMVKTGAVIIDVGCNRFEDKLCGDVDFAALENLASAMTPVPGGVGPMTVACLLENTITAAERLHGFRP
jgi:methylenetetrahydrofolate dehydrogenase (NADP+)/methenyltetrahydrofolate cyclohydrolase